MPSNTAQQLLDVLEDLGVEIPQGAYPVRLRPTPQERAAGAWTWCLAGTDGTEYPVGSPTSMGDLLKAPDMSVEQSGNDTVVRPVYDTQARHVRPRLARARRQDDTRIPTYKPVRVSGIQIVELLVDNAPDITPEYSTIIFTFRPSLVEIRYQSDNAGVWSLLDIRVIGRPLNKDHKGVNMTTRKTHSVTYIDLSGEGGVQRAKTPAWVVALAKEYADPGNIPTIE